MRDSLPSLSGTASAAKDRITETRLYSSASDAKETITDSWPYRKIEDTSDRLTSRLYGPHSYGPHEDVEELKEEIYMFKPPKEGYNEDEYLEEIKSVLENRKERLEKQHDSPRTWRATRMKLDEVKYIVARGGLAAGGASLVYSATISPSLPFTLWGYTAGPAMLAGAPIGVTNAIGEIREYNDPENVREDIDLYESVLNELEEDGTDALPDNFSEWLNIVGVGRKKVSFRLNDGEYVKD